MPFSRSLSRKATTTFHRVVRRRPSTTPGILWSRCTSNCVFLYTSASDTFRNKIPTVGVLRRPVFALCFLQYRDDLLLAKPTPLHFVLLFLSSRRTLLFSRPLFRIRPVRVKGNVSRHTSKENRPPIRKIEQSWCIFVTDLLQSQRHSTGINGTGH
jgi:hypothetical protein